MMKPCPECDGTGTIVEPADDDEDDEEEYTCDRCHGTGQIPDDEE